MKNTLHLHFWFQIHSYMQTTPYISIIFLHNLNIFHTFKVIESRTQCPAARRAFRMIVLYWLDIDKKLIFFFKIDGHTLKMRYNMCIIMNIKYVKSNI